MKLYLVGDDKSMKTNDWLAVCKDKGEAERLLGLWLNATMVKEVEVKGAAQ